ncbi:MAG TPA: DUF1707 domain-containing protein [Acidimicrobiales bacterium]|nr:DUF1707 domain-containing protein [Acidimicrobiales bacterium]
MLPEHDPRIADTDRDRAVAVLRMHCTEGRITLDEFSDRVGEVYNARTAGELDAVVADLPVPWSHEPAREEEPDARRRSRSVRWLVAIFSSSSRRGRFTLDDEAAVIAAFGDCTLDLSEASIDGPNPLVSVVALFGNVTVVVPEGIEVNLQGLPLFGSTRCDTGSAPPRPGSPVVTVRAFAAFGDVRVRLPRDRGDRRFGRPQRR